MAIMHIREVQMRALREVTLLHSIEGGLCRHFPDQCQELGPARLQRFVEQSMDAARALGFGVEQYLPFAALQMVFGQNFWEFEEHEWARRILEDRFLWTPKHKMHELRQASIFKLAEIAEEEPVWIEDEDEEHPVGDIPECPPGMLPQTTGEPLSVRGDEVRFNA
jgi:hypothetical protein